MKAIVIVLAILMVYSMGLMYEQDKHIQELQRSVDTCGDKINLK